jgi:hypothetical protein
MSPVAGPFKMLTGASAAYGLTEGAAQASVISLTPLGRRIVAPTVEGDDEVAKREAFLKPVIIGKFLRHYDGSSLPSAVVAKNVLVEMGVPEASSEMAYRLILEGADSLGLLADINGKKYVQLDGVAPPRERQASPATKGGSEAEDEMAGDGHDPIVQDPPLETPLRQQPVDSDRVFITHGSNRDIVNQLKEILTFGKFNPIVSVDKESVSKPVPDKVMDDMRGCYAAVIHVGAEMRLMDPEGNEHNIINSNVLIEIGAAMALYARRFVLLVERGVTLPSNLQGLYEVRYEGDKLDYEATMKLLKAFNEFRAA